MKLPLSLALAVSLAAPVTTQEAAPAPLAKLGWFGELVGHCYVGTLPDGASRDTQCYAALMEHAVRGTISVERPGGPAFQGEGTFGFDKATGQIAYVLVAPGGTFTPGTAVYEDGRLLFPQRVPAGKPEARSAWTRTADGYTVTREVKDESGAWKPAFAVSYAKVNP